MPFRMVVNLLHDSQWPQTPNPPVSDSSVLRLQVYTTVHRLTKKLDTKRGKHVLFDNILMNIEL